MSVWLLDCLSPQQLLLRFLLLWLLVPSSAWPSTGSANRHNKQIFVVIEPGASLIHARMRAANAAMTISALFPKFFIVAAHEGADLIY